MAARKCRGDSGANEGRQGDGGREGARRGAAADDGAAPEHGRKRRRGCTEVWSEAMRDRREARHQTTRRGSRAMIRATTRQRSGSRGGDPAAERQPRRRPGGGAVAEAATQRRSDTRAAPGYRSFFATAPGKMSENADMIGRFGIFGQLFAPIAEDGGRSCLFFAVCTGQP